MIMQHVVTYELLRPSTKPDPYNPEATVEDWSDPDRLKIDGFISTNGSLESPDGPRTLLTDTATFTIPDPSADIRRGDVVVDDLGRKWQVTGHPRRDKNPFTGWQPTTVCTLTAWQG